MHSKTKQNTKRKSRLLRIAVFAFLCFVCYTIIKLQIGVAQMRTTLAAIEADTAAIILSIEEKQITLDEGLTKETVERIARDTLSYVYPDETIYTDLP